MWLIGCANQTKQTGGPKRQVGQPQWESCHLTLATEVARPSVCPKCQPQTNVCNMNVLLIYLRQ